jgi:hypothetical protein
MHQCNSAIGRPPHVHERTAHPTFHKDMINSSGHPHKVPIKTVYITGAKDKEAAQAAAVRHWDEEKGGASQVADSVEAEEEPDGIQKKTV